MNMPLKKLFLFLLLIICWHPNLFYAQSSEKKGEFSAISAPLSLSEKSDLGYKGFSKNIQEDHSILAELGRKAILDKRWGDAKDFFNRIRKENPENVEAYYYLGICYRETGKFKALILRKLDWDKSRKYFEKAISLDSLFNDVFYQYAVLKRYQEKYKEAVLLGHQQIELKPELVEPQVRLFRLYRYLITHTGEKKVINWLENQLWDQAKYAIGEKLRRAGKINQADSVFQKLLKQKPAMPEQPILLSLARIYYEKKQLQKAERYYWQAVDGIKNQIEANLVFEDAKYIFTDAELSEFESLKSTAKIIDFFHSFWAKRDPVPAAKTNYRLAEHYRRLLYVEKYYEYDGFRTWFNNPDQMGYFDFNRVYELNHEFNDMGFIYLRFGKPDDWAKTSGHDVPANESWLYYQTQTMPGMTFHFSTKNSPSAWRFTPIIIHPEILEDRLSWGNVYFRLLRADPLERFQLQNEMAKLSSESVEKGISNDRHTWENDIKPLRIPFSLATFRGEPGKTKLEIYYAVSLAPLLKDSKSSEIQIKAERGVAVHDLNWHPMVSQHDTLLLPMSRKEFVIDYYRFELPPDSYHVALFLKPTGKNYLGGWKIDYNIDDYYQSRLKMSDIQLASLITAEKPNSRFNKNGLFVLPNAGKSFFKDKPIYVYFEIYNLLRDSAGRTNFTIEYTLTFFKGEKRKAKNLFGLLGSSGKSAISTSIDREGDDEFSFEYLAIDVSGVKKGHYQLSVKVTDNLNQATTMRQTFLDLN